jgi:hypothetical protein
MTTEYVLEELEADKVFELIRRVDLKVELERLVSQPDHDILYRLAWARERFQKSRIALGNRVNAIIDGRASVSEAGLGVNRVVFQMFLDLERYYESLTTRVYQSLAKDDPFMTRLLGIRGLGICLAAQALTVVNYPTRFPGRFDTVSKLWRFCGFGVLDGKAERNVYGEKAHFSRRAQVTFWKVGQSLMRAKGPYYEFYSRTRERLEQRGDLTKLGVHQGALRRMIKLFLAHMWTVARVEHGLPIRPPYALEYLQHQDYIPPEEYGW